MKDKRHRSVPGSLEGRKWGVALLALCFVRLLWAAPAFSQSERATDLGAILGAKAEVPLAGDLALQVEEELRFEGWGGAHLDHWLNELTVEYPFLHHRMHVGVSGGAIRRYNDRGYYENRARLGLDVTYAETVRRFKLSYRSRLTATFRDASVADYRVNPKLYWRHRLQATYQLPGSRFKYALSTELHWLLNDPKQRVVDNLRTVLTVNYRLTRRQSVSVFLRMDNDLQVVQPMDRFYLGLTYQYKS